MIKKYYVDEYLRIFIYRCEMYFGKKGFYGVGKIKNIIVSKIWKFYIRNYNIIYIKYEILL